MKISVPLRIFILIVCANLWLAQVQALSITTPNAQQIFTDTTAHGHIKTHHFIQLGLTVQEGQQFVRTRNNYTHTTDDYNNNLVEQRSRYISFRAGHEVLFKNIVSAGITYGFDLAYIPHDIKAFVPVLLHVSKDVRVSKRLSFLFTERLGYSFYLRNPSDDNFEQLTGVAGGFTAETLAGLNVWGRQHKAAFQLLPGYRLQQLHSKMIFSPVPVANPGLPANITEISNGFYNFLYFAFGVTF